MAISPRQDFGNIIAKTILDEIQLQRSKYYYFFGAVEPWEGIGKEDLSDIAPLTVPRTEKENRRIRSEMVYAKQISPNDVSLVIEKINWTYGTQYDNWDDSIDMDGKHFYVRNSQNNVYKCLDNGAKFGAVNPSLVEPSSVSIYPFHTSDGYLWKYMYSIPAYADSRFGSNDFMPVKNALTDSYYNNGSIDSVSVVSSGSGYSDADLTTIAIVNPVLTGSGAVATLTVNASGTITNVTVTNGGTGYTKGVRVTITGTGGGAELTAVVSPAGVIQSITIVSGGIGYSSLDTVNFQLGGAILKPVVSKFTGSLTAVKIIDPGVGYISTQLSLVGTGGSGKYGNATALLSAVVYEGKIVQVNIQDPGVGYPVDSSTTIVAQGDGAGAEFTPVVFEGRLIDVVIENPGVGYTEVILTVTSPTGTGAKLRGLIAQSDFKSEQAAIEQTAVDGAIYKIKIDNPGIGYAQFNTTITIQGNGTGATAVPVVENGRIVAINMTNFGQGYTFATVNISNPDVILEANKASATAVLPPIGGHGRDAIRELFCNTMAINSPLVESIAAQTVTQEYRMFGILKEPVNLFSGSRYNRQSLWLFHEVRVQSTIGMYEDQILYLGNNRFRVFDFDATTAKLIPLDSVTISPVGTMVDPTNSSQYIISDVIGSLDFNKYSGKLLYVSTENPFQFSADQSITIKTFIRF